VDKRLAGLQAVQTLARLNRTHPLKTKTFVMDFQNTMEDIREAFAPYFETTALEDRTDVNQIYDLESKISGSTYILKDEVQRFGERFYKGDHSPQSRLELEGIVRNAVGRFELDEDEAQQEEFRQLLRSFMRFYAFVAQVTPLNDTWLEKMYVYTSWLSRLLPSREVPAEISLNDEMLQLSAFRLNKEEEGSASLQAGDTDVLSPITEFGANAYTEEEEKSLSEIIQSFNERHGTQFSREDFLRFERVTRDIMDDDMIEMVRNNPADVVYTAFSQAFFQGMVKMFQQDNEMRNIVMTDKEAREQATRHFFKRAQRQARG
jgi:type I restriction enzyme R subunit